MTTERIIPDAPVIPPEDQESAAVWGFSDTAFEMLEGGSVRVRWKPNYRISGMMALGYPFVRSQVESKGRHWMELMKEAIEAEAHPIRGL